MVRQVRFMKIMAFDNLVTHSPTYKKVILNITPSNITYTYMYNHKIINYNHLYCFDWIFKYFLRPGWLIRVWTGSELDHDPAPSLSLSSLSLSLPPSLYSLPTLPSLYSLPTLPSLYSLPTLSPLYLCSLPLTPFTIPPFSPIFCLSGSFFLSICLSSHAFHVVACFIFLYFATLFSPPVYCL